MDVELVFAPEAEEDIANAYNWYERHRLGLGEDFLSCLAPVLMGYAVNLNCIQQYTKITDGL